jgi:hypothetical protein
MLVATEGVSILQRHHPIPHATIIPTARPRRVREPLASLPSQ